MIVHTHTHTIFYCKSIASEWIHMYELPCLIHNLGDCVTFFRHFHAILSRRFCFLTQDNAMLNSLVVMLLIPHTSNFWNTSHIVIIIQYFIVYQWDQLESIGMSCSCLIQIWISVFHFCTVHIFQTLNNPYSIYACVFSINLVFQ